MVKISVPTVSAWGGKNRKKNAPRKNPNYFMGGGFPLLALESEFSSAFGEKKYHAQRNFHRRAGPRKYALKLGFPAC